jgi:zinc protease
MDKTKAKKYLNWSILGLITISLIILTSNVAFAKIPSHYSDLKFPPLPSIQLPEYERYQLDNGMLVYLVEDHQLPLVTGTAMIRTGERLDPDSQLGLAEITGELMRTGGTTQHSEDELDQILEQKAASVETSIGKTSGRAGFTALSDDLETVLNLFAEVLRYPIFTEEQLTFEKTKLKGEISRRNDDPNSIASREFSKLIYGENSPYARTVEYENLDNISRDDVIEFYKKYVRPDQIILGIVGDFNPNQLKKMINDTFADWVVDAPLPETSIATPSQNLTEGVFLVDQPQLTQSNILLGHIGGELINPDYPTLSVINGILNGYGGRLYNQVRSKQGLAYSVYGLWRAAYDYPGFFVAGGQTKSETTIDFIESIFKEIERLRIEPITEAELNYAKESILNSFVFEFENASQTLSRLMTYEYYGYPDDFIFKYQKGVKETTREDVLRVAKKYLQPNQIVTLIVGNARVIEPSLSRWKTEVQTVDITIPKPQKS